MTTTGRPSRCPRLRVIDELHREFRESLYPEALKLEPFQLRRAHRDYAQVLEDLASYHCRAEFVPDVYGRISDRLAAAYADLGDLRLDGRRNLLDAWEESRDGTSPTRRGLPRCSASTTRLSSRRGRRRHLNDRAYREVIWRKIEAVCHRAALPLSRRVKARLDEMIDGLSLLAEAEHNEEPAPSELLQEILLALA